jgi:hypothetical protein
LAFRARFSGKRTTAGLWATAACILDVPLDCRGDAHHRPRRAARRKNDNAACINKKSPRRPNATFLRCPSGHQKSKSGTSSRMSIEVTDVSPPFSKTGLELNPVSVAVTIHFLIRSLGSLLQVCENRGGSHSISIQFLARIWPLDGFERPFHYPSPAASPYGPGMKSSNKPSSCAAHSATPPH